MLRWRGQVTTTYDDVLTSDVAAAIDSLAPFDADRRALMQARLDRRAGRRQRRERIGFLNPDDRIARTSTRVQDARWIRQVLDIKGSVVFGHVASVSFV